mmetsp:Transcript_8427/g.27605  ORF Transcript_8427/g.27605 Transcript_8427/m.27605 type:complete len:201 (+) Transcript_8427:490-1092(+)
MFFDEALVEDDAVVERMGEAAVEDSQDREEDLEVVEHRLRQENHEGREVTVFPEEPQDPHPHQQGPDVDHVRGSPIELGLPLVVGPNQAVAQTRHEPHPADQNVGQLDPIQRVVTPVLRDDDDEPTAAALAAALAAAAQSKHTPEIRRRHEPRPRPAEVVPHRLLAPRAYAFRRQGDEEEDQHHVHDDPEAGHDAMQEPP